jgi:uncharacterized protein (DUF58 family)
VPDEPRPLLPEPTEWLVETLGVPGRGLIVPWALERLRWRYTATGRALLAVFFVSGLLSLSVNTEYAIHFLSFGFLILFATSWLVALLVRPRVRIEREIPSRCAVGATVIVRARVTNVGRSPAFDVSATEVPARFRPRVRVSSDRAYASVLAPGETVELEYTLEPTLRGAYDFLGPAALTAFPFGLEHARRRVRAPHRMLVYPRFARLAFLDLPVGRKYQPGGLELVSEVGDSGEFVGTREYRPGDALRLVHHAAWARLGFPVVREFQEEYLCRVALVLDTQTPRGFVRERLRLESAISLGAAVAEVLSRQEYVVDLFAAGPDLYHFEAGRSLAYLDNILDVLACVEGTRRNPFETLAPAIAEELDKISTAVVVLLDWDDARVRFVRSLEEAGVAVKVIVVHESRPSSDPRGFVTRGGPVTLLAPAQIDAGVDRL